MPWQEGYASRDVGGIRGCERGGRGEVAVRTDISHRKNVDSHETNIMAR